MRFIIPINDKEGDSSITFHAVETNSDCARTNKRLLKEYFLEMGVRQHELKRVMKAMGFWGSNLGKKNESTKSTPSIH